MSALEKNSSVATTSNPRSPRSGTEVQPFEGIIKLSPKSMGRFFGPKGESFRKYVTGKSAFAVKRAYTEFYENAVKEVDGNLDDKSVRYLTPPEDLGSILISIKFPPAGEINENASQIPYTTQIINDKENLSKFMNIVKNNIDKHAANCTVKKDPNDRFTHKIVFVAEIDHEGQIGKFIGNRGKNIKHLTNQVIDSLGTSKVNISIVPSNTEIKRPPWKNKYIRLDTNPDNHFEVHIIVSANIPGGHHADYKKTMCALTPIISQSVINLQKVKESSSEIMASEFLDNISPQYLPGCTDYSNDDW